MKTTDEMLKALRKRQHELTGAYQWPDDVWRELIDAALDASPLPAVEAEMRRLKDKHRNMDTRIQAGRWLSMLNADAPKPVEKHVCDYPACSVRGAGHPLACGCRSAVNADAPSITTTQPMAGYPQNITNPDDWKRFLARYVDNRATNAVHDGIGLIALHIVDAINNGTPEIAAKDPQPRPDAALRALVMTLALIAEKSTPSLAQRYRLKAAIDAAEREGQS